MAKKKAAALVDKDTPDSVASEVISRNLVHVPGPMKYNGNGTVMIWCPFHGDPNDPMIGTPSMVLNLTQTDRFPVGFAHCWSCNTNKNWNDIARVYGLERYQEGDDAQTFAKKKDFDKVRRSLLDDQEGVNFDDLCTAARVPLHLPWYKGMKWRGLKSKTMMALGAHYGLDEQTEDQAAILPVYVEHVLRGMVKARWETMEGQPSYINSTGKWAKEWGLLGLDPALEMGDGKTVILGEGPRDGLRLLQEKLPGVGILGATNWTKKKRDVLVNAGVENVILCMDADAAGRRAKDKIKADCESHMTVKVFGLKKYKIKYKMDKCDPGNMPQEAVDRLRKMWNSLRTDI